MNCNQNPDGTARIPGMMPVPGPGPVHVDGNMPGVWDRFPVGMGYVPMQNWETPISHKPRFYAGNDFPVFRLSVYDGRVQKMAEMNCGASGKDPGVTGQCCKKSCQVQTCCRPVCPPPGPRRRRLRISWYVSAGRNCLRDPSRYGQGCGMCPGMDPSRQALMKQINEASFAVDEAVLVPGHPSGLRPGHAVLPERCRRQESGHGRIPEPVRPPAGG